MHYADANLRLASLGINRHENFYRQHGAQRKRRYLSYSEADFEVFRPAGGHAAPMGVKFGTKVPSSMPNFTPIGAMTSV